MRLPWPFGRRTSPDGPPSAAPGDGGIPAPVAAPDHGIAAPTRAWAALPPIQRTTGDAPLVAPSAPFLAGVPGHVPLPPILRPLGHEAGPTAPPGIVVAHARPVPSLTSDVALASRPVQRRRAPEAASMPALIATEPAVEAQPAPSGSSVPAAASVAEPDPIPVRHLATVSPGATVTPPARPLTQAAPALVPVSKPGVPRSATVAQRMSATLPGEARQPTALGLGAPIAHDAAQPTLDLPRTVSRWAEARPPASPAVAAATPAAGTQPRPAPADMPRPAADATLGAGTAPGRELAPARPRRPGLGAPIAMPPASAVAQRLPMRPTASSPDRATPHVATAAGAAARMAAPPAGAEDNEALTRVADGPPAVATADVARAHADHPSARSLPVLPVARRRRDGPEADVEGLSRPATTNPTVARGPVTVPILGARPLRPVLTAQRRASEAVSAVAPVPAPPAPPVAARWVAPETLPDRITSLPGTGVASGGHAHSVQLSPVPPAGITPSAEPAPAIREITFPAPDADAVPGTMAAGAPSVQRAVPGSSAIAIQRSALGPAVTIGHRDTDPARATPARQPERPLTLARLSASATPQGPVSSTSGSPGEARPTVGWIVADPVNPAAPPTVQTSRPSSGGTPVATITATPVVQREQAPAQATPPTPQGHSDAELDELASALFGRIRGHLRAEVIHEREAKGLTFDAF